MSDALDRFRAVVQALDATAPGGLGIFYVEKAHGSYRKALLNLIETKPDRKLLVAGQRGSGKSTLLLKVAEELRQHPGRLVVLQDLATLISVEDPTPLEVNLAALAGLLEEASRRTTTPPEVLRECQTWLDDLEWPGQGNDAGALAKRLNHLLMTLRDSPGQRAALRGSLRGKQQPAEVLTTVVRHFTANAQVPLLILDGLDKVPADRAPELFQTRPLAGMATGAIVTLPLSMTYDATFPGLRDDYDNIDSCVLRALQAYTRRDGERKTDGADFSTLREILTQRIRAANEPTKNVVASKAIKLVIMAAGGNLREMNKLLQESMIKASLEDRTQVKEKDVKAAIGDRRETYRRGYRPEFLPILRTVLQTGDLPDRSGLGRQLIDGLWVVEYRNGRDWYDLPQPVRELVEDIEAMASGAA